MLEYSLQQEFDQNVLDWFHHLLHIPLSLSIFPLTIGGADCNHKADPGPDPPVEEKSWRSSIRDLGQLGNTHSGEKSKSSIRDNLGRDLQFEETFESAQWRKVEEKRSRSSIRNPGQLGNKYCVEKSKSSIRDYWGTEAKSSTGEEICNLRRHLKMHSGEKFNPGQLGNTDDGSLGTRMVLLDWKSIVLQIKFSLAFFCPVLGYWVYQVVTKWSPIGLV